MRQRKEKSQNQVVSVAARKVARDISDACPVIDSRAGATYRGTSCRLPDTVVAWKVRVEFWQSVTMDPWIGVSKRSGWSVFDHILLDRCKHGFKLLTRRRGGISRSQLPGM